MKKKHFRSRAVALILTLSLVMTAFISVPVFASGITPEQLDEMVIDPQSWDLHREMTWTDFLPNPVIDWDTEMNTAGLAIKTDRMEANERKIQGGLILLDYLDKKFYSGMELGSSPLGFWVFDHENGGYINYGDPDSIVKDPVVSILQYPDVYTNGYEDLPKFWHDFLNDPDMDAVYPDTYPANHPYAGEPHPFAGESLNHGATINGYWLENSYGRWGADLKPYGVYTIPYFEFEVSGTGFQTYRDVPPTFRYTTPAAEGERPAAAGEGDTRSVSFDHHALEITKTGRADYEGNPWGIPEGAGGMSSSIPVDYSEFDFFFFAHAGYDESGAWQELGQMQWDSREAIPWDMGPGPRLLQVEEFFNTYPEWVPVYAERYKDGWANYTGEWHEDRYAKDDPVYAAAIEEYRQVAFWEETLDAWRIKYDPTHPNYNANATFEFKLPQEDWDWANSYHGKDADEGRPGDDSVNDGTIYYTGKSHLQNTRYVAYTSWQAATAEWSHAGSAPIGPHPDTGSEYGRLLLDRDIPLPRSCQGENDGLGTFAHEFGHIASISDNYGNPWTRLSTPVTEPWDIMSRGSFGGPFGDHARWSTMPIEGASVPVHGMQNVKNIWNYYADTDLLVLEVATMPESTPIFANIVARNIPIDNVYYPDLGVDVDEYVKGIQLIFDFEGDYADQAPLSGEGYTNFHTGANYGPATRMGVEVVQRTGYDSYNHDSGVMISRTGRFTNAGHALVDSHLYDIDMTDFYLGGEPNVYPTAHATQLADALFKVGKSYVDTGYYGAIRDAEGNIIKAGSEWRWDEDRDGRPIVSGDSVNEWYDEYNGLHFYILEKHMNPGKYSDFLSYEVAVRHDEGLAIEGTLELEVKTPATAVQVGNYAVQTYALTNTGATEVDIVRIGLEGDLAKNRTKEIVVDMTARNQVISNPDPKFGVRTVPLMFSEQNAVILNDLYSIAPGETVEFDVYIKQLNSATIDNLDTLLTVVVSSETNADNVVMYPVPVVVE